jgi:hypothetical protein
MRPSAKLPQADHRLKGPAPLNHVVMVSDVPLGVHVLDCLRPRRAQALQHRRGDPRKGTCFEEG